MKGKQFLARRQDFTRIYEYGRSWKNRYLVLRILPNNLDYTRYGFSVSRKVGNAVVRNRIKRRLREMMRSKPLSAGWDVVLVARKPACQANYDVLQQALDIILRRAGIMVESHENTGSETN